MLNSKGFDLWADGYDESVGLSDEHNTYPFAGYKRLLNRIYNIVLQKERPAVLDLGFGTAVLTSRLYQAGCAVYGQDFSPRMLEIAQGKMPEAVLVEGDLADGLAAPLKERKYDFIIATYSLHHLDLAGKARLIRELREHLNEGGQILIGDVAFQTREALEACRRAAGDDWDADEIYFVFEEMRAEFPDMRFEALPPCAGLLTLANK